MKLFNKLFGSGNNENNIDLKSLFGCDKISIETINIPKSIISSNMTINHSLGEIPKVCIMCLNDMNSVVTGNYGLNGIFFFNRSQSDSSEIANEFSYDSNWSSSHSASVYASSITDSSFIINSVDYGNNVRYFFKGDYTLITMA